MNESLRTGTSSKLVARAAVVGMAIAVAALGALAVWAAIGSQNAASELSRAGVQTSGHLRAVQAIGVIDTQTDALSGPRRARAIGRLREAETVLDDALARMEDGDNRADSRLAVLGRPMARRLRPAVERYIAAALRPGQEAERAEEAMDVIVADFEVLMNDLDADPSLLLASKLESVSDTERAVRATAYVLIPLGFLGVAGCGWLLGAYRRRSDAAMLAAIDVSDLEARTDELTALANRRGLLEALDAAFATGEPFTFALADLNGFKRYNDTFGHPAGDVLLARLGRKLAAACEGRGVAARLGGDEFCVLLDPAASVEEAETIVQRALRDEGEGFSITAALGVVTLPAEASDASAALRLADSRMYAGKLGGRRSAEEEITAALTRMLDERHPGLASHVEDVTELATACAAQLGLPVDDIRAVEHAAALHDIGKVAIPADILTKPGSLTEDEWLFVRRHSCIGERILLGVPALQRVAPLVRSSHERWDGTGYPDRLAGADIPLGARIVFVADAYCAMTEDRPYADRRTAEAARAELRDGAGSQFDPSVVAAFLAVLDARAALSLASTSVG